MIETKMKPQNKNQNLSKIRAGFSALALCLAAGTLVTGSEMTGTNFKIPSNAVNAGGDSSQAPSYKMLLSQTAYTTNLSVSAGYKLLPGFVGSSSIPNTIVDLNAEEVGAGMLKLSWTTPIFPDHNPGGGRYIVKWALTPILTENDFVNAPNTFAQAWVPLAENRSEERRVGK